MRWSSIGRIEDTQPEQVEAGTAVHLAFNQLQSMDLSFYLTVAPRHLQRRQHSGLIADEVGGEAGQRGPLGRLKPAGPRSRVARSNDAKELVRGSCCGCDLGRPPIEFFEVRACRSRFAQDQPRRMTGRSSHSRRLECTARPVLTPWLCRKSMISRICIPSCQALAIRTRRLGPIPSTDSRSTGLLPITPSTSAPKCPTSLFARTGPIPFTKPPPRYRSTPSLVVGGTAFKTVALNWSPCSLSRIHQPVAVNHSPALTDGNDPRTVTRSRCLLTFTRSTANPLSSSKKVIRSISPAISSDGIPDCGEGSLTLIEVYAICSNSSAYGLRVVLRRGRQMPDDRLLLVPSILISVQS